MSSFPLLPRYSFYGIILFPSLSFTVYRISYLYLLPSSTCIIFLSFPRDLPFSLNMDRFERSVKAGEELQDHRYHIRPARDLLADYTDTFDVRQTLLFPDSLLLREMPRSRLARATPFLWNCKGPRSTSFHAFCCSPLLRSFVQLDHRSKRFADLARHRQLTLVYSDTLERIQDSILR